MEAVAQEANAWLHVEVSRNPPVPHLLHLREEKRREPIRRQGGAQSIRREDVESVINHTNSQELEVATHLEDPDQVGGAVQ